MKNNYSRFAGPDGEDVAGRVLVKTNSLLHSIGIEYLVDLRFWSLFAFNRGPFTCTDHIA